MPNFSIPLSGLTAESTALSAIANNLANQNTVGYKDTSVLFSDLFYQQLGTAGSGDPIQVGAGTEVGSMPALFTQGDLESTGVPTDVAIQGSGFFVVQNSDGSLSYTRAGDFNTNDGNTLQTSSGQQVLGFPAVNGVVNTSAPIAPITLGTGTLSPPTATTNVQLTTNLDASATPGTTFSTPVTVYDSLGASHVLNFNFTNTGPGAWTYNITIPAADVGATGNPVQVATGVLAFNSSGQLITPPANVTGITVGNLPGIGVPGTGALSDGASALTFTWQLFNGTTPLLTQLSSPSSTSATNQNGFGSGSLDSFSIGSDGTITGSFSNGQTQALGQLALANFANPDGLQLDGTTNYSPTLASGAAVTGVAGTGGLGTISGGSLEESNVDIATEFSNLIVAQRGFEADAKAVTTFDQITQDTIALKQ
jgi:flagellar hook protein FlgE